MDEKTVLKFEPHLRNDCLLIAWGHKNKVFAKYIDFKEYQKGKTKSFTLLVRDAIEKFILALLRTMQKYDYIDYSEYLDFFRLTTPVLKKDVWDKYRYDEWVKQGRPV